MQLPVDDILPELRSALVERRTAVLQAPPGAGKTTRVPLALRNEPWLAGRRIILLEPRRLAARAAAHHMAQLLGESVGDTVGYRMRLDTRVGPRTRIEVVTEGILTRMLQHDLALDGTGLVIFDEFHERSLIADTGLALTLASAESLRPDLRIVVMSATLDHVALTAVLGDAPVIRSVGRVWPVETRHVAPRADSRIEAHVARVVRDALHTEAGSILVFLAGAGEIRRVQQQLDSGLDANVSVHALHGSLPLAAQDAAIAPAAPGHRKVVLATSIAETSLTIEGIRVVVDSGEMRVPRFSPRTGMTRLETMRVSRASADQRRGRAGRLEPGVCLRCWSAADDAGLLPYTRAEILDADLAPLMLDLAGAGFSDASELRWIDPPPAAALATARELLQLLGALNTAGRITPLGESMVALGGHPRLAGMVIRAGELGPAELSLAADLAAIMEERDLLRGMDGPPPVDMQLRVDAIAGDVSDMMLGGATVDRGLAARVREVAAEWRRRAGGKGSRMPSSDASCGDLLALAFPDRMAQRRDAPGRFLLRNGRGVTIPVTDPLAQADWITAVAVDDAGREGRVSLAARLDIGDVLARMPEQVVVRDEVAWDVTLRQVTARRRTFLGALVLRDVALGNVDPDQLRAALTEGIRRTGIDALPWSDAARRVRHRLAALHHHDATWPDVTNDALADSLDGWLGPVLSGVRSIAGLEQVDLGAALLGRLTWQQRAAMDTLVPERIEVPSGSRVAIDYSDPVAPVCAVRLQEVFGLSASPSIMDGRVALTMHLLSPAYRPVQVTRDLASFWAAGYFDVRKDLRGRYPRHHWPEDPLTAAAVRGAKRRKS